MQRLLVLRAVGIFVVLGAAYASAAFAGAFYIAGGGCLCEARTIPGAWNSFAVWFVPSDQSECPELVGAAFRVEGVPDDPALVRRFEPLLRGSMSGDAFGEGAVFRNLDPLPGETEVGFIHIYVTEPLSPQVWSVEAHLGLEGVTMPVVEFSRARGTWLAQPGHSIAIDSTADCNTCQDPRLYTCAFAIEQATWSSIRTLFR